MAELHPETGVATRSIPQPQQSFSTKHAMGKSACPRGYLHVNFASEDQGTLSNVRIPVRNTGSQLLKNHTRILYTPALLLQGEKTVWGSQELPCAEE